MADHFSGPRALTDPASDITDVSAAPTDRESATAWTGRPRRATRSFPYLVSPNPDPPDLKAVLLAVASAPPEGATSSPD